MSYELWIYKDPSATPNPYILFDANSDTASSASRTIQEAFETFGVNSVSIYQRAPARASYNIIPIPYLENYCNDHPELLI